MEDWAEDRPIHPPSFHTIGTGWDIQTMRDGKVGYLCFAHEIDESLGIKWGGAVRKREIDRRTSSHRVC